MTEVLAATGDDRLPLIHAAPRVRLDGQARPDMAAAVQSLALRLPLAGPASLELQLRNWAQTERGPDFVFDDLLPGQHIEILLGEAARAPAFRGTISAIEERYGEGAPQRVLLAEDALQELARHHHSRSFTDLSPDDVVRAVAEENGLTADVQISTARGQWLQLAESDLGFLYRLLAPWGTALRLDGEGRLRARPEQPDPQPVRLDPDANLSRLRLVADLNRQPAGMRAQGWDLAGDRPARGQAEALQPPPSGHDVRHWLDNAGWRDTLRLRHPFAFSAALADQWAHAALQTRNERLVHGEIVCPGLPHMAAGREVSLTGVSPRLRGTYRVVDCLHRFDRRHGFTTRLRVQRPWWGEGEGP